MKTVKLNAAPPANERPKCAYCAKPMRPYYVPVEEHRSGPVSSWKIVERWDGKYHSYGAFCTMRCGLNFANREVARARRAKSFPIY